MLTGLLGGLSAVNKSIKIFNVYDIQISIDYTWFIIFFLVAWTLAYGYFPATIPELERPIYILMGGVSSILLFCCVLVHELSHSLVANRNGMEVKEITLFIFGGVARLSKEPEDPKAELKVALAGPLSSGVLALCFWGLKEGLNALAVFPVLSAVSGYLALVNIILVVFNIIPGFPLDGGRVLRAIWWLKTGDLQGATRVTSNVGKGFSLLLIIFGVFQIFAGNMIGGLWAVFIGLFLQQAASSGYREVVIKIGLEGIRVGDFMTRKVITVKPEFTIQMVVDEYFLRYHVVSFPVVSSSGVVGLLTFDAVRALRKEDWVTTQVKDIMEPLSQEVVLGKDDTARDALSKMISLGTGRLLVMDKGMLVGIISRRDIMKLVAFKRELGQ